MSETDVEDHLTGDRSPDPLHMLEPSVKQRSEWNRVLENKEVVHPRQWYVWMELFQHYPFIVALGVQLYRSLRTMWKIKSKQWPVSKWGIGEVEPWLSVPSPAVSRSQILYQDVASLRAVMEATKAKEEQQQYEERDSTSSSDADSSRSDSDTGVATKDRGAALASSIGSSRRIKDASPKILGAIGWVLRPYETSGIEKREDYDEALGIWLLNAIRHQKNCAAVFLRTLPVGYFNLDEQVTDKKSTAMVLAAQDNFCLGISEMLRVGAGLNFPRADGFTPLHAAAYWDAPEATQLLVSYKADHSLTNKDHELPIHCAAHSQNSSTCLKILLDGGAKVDSFKNPRWKMTATHIACRSNSIVCLKVLLQYGADLMQRDVEGWWGAHYAVCNGHIEVLNFIRDDLGIDLMQVEEEHMRKYKQGANFFLMGCAHNSGVPALQWLLDRYPSKDFITKGCSTTGEYPSSAEDDDGNNDAVHPSLENPLFTAVLQGNIDIIQFLLENGADTLKASGRDNLTPFQGLRYIAPNKRAECTKLLISHGNSHLKSTLANFSSGGAWDISTMSSAAGTTTTRERQDYANEVMRLSRFNPELVAFFIDECKVNPLFVQGPGEIPVFLRNCAEQPMAEKHAGIATFLTSRGVDINCRDRTVWGNPTALDVLRKSLKSGPPPNETGFAREKEFLELGAISSLKAPSVKFSFAPPQAK